MDCFYGIMGFDLSFLSDLLVLLEVFCLFVVVMVELNLDEVFFGIFDFIYFDNIIGSWGLFVLD